MVQPLEALGGALRFIKRVRADSQFRKDLYLQDSPEALGLHLKSQNMDFTPQDLDGAYMHLLTNCQDKSEADEIKEIVIWYSFLIGENE